MDVLFSTMKTSPDKEIGHIDFSYGVVAKSFERCLSATDCKMKFVPRPEFIPKLKDVEVHLMMRKFRAFRPVNGAYNIAVISWEFNQLQKDSNEFDGIFYNQVDMLKMADEIWVASSHLKEVFESYGLSNVHFIPCPIGLPYWDDEEEISLQNKLDKSFDSLGFINSIAYYFSTGTDKLAETKPLYFNIPDIKNKKIFLTVFNPHDHRKNISKLIESFSSFSAKYKNAYLVIKCNTDLKLLTTVLDLIWKRSRKGVDTLLENIIIINERLDESELKRLYDLADFYFCLSHGEGQNLPLQESMARGCIPVSVSNTAMSDCVNSKSAFEIRSREIPINIEDKVCFHKIENLTWYEVSLSDVYQALERSMLAEPDELESKMKVCQEIIGQLYSDRAVGELSTKRLVKIYG